MSTANLHYGCGLACNATCCVVFYITDLKDGALRTVGVTATVFATWFGSETVLGISSEFFKTASVLGGVL